MLCEFCAYHFSLGSEGGENIFERKGLKNEDKAIKLANDWIDKKGEFK